MPFFKLEIHVFIVTIGRGSWKTPKIPFKRGKTVGKSFEKYVSTKNVYYATYLVANKDDKSDFSWNRPRFGMILMKISPFSASNVPIKLTSYGHVW